jgi:hypothetical protein
VKARGYLHDDDEGQLGGQDVPELHGVLVLLPVAGGVAVVSVPGDTQPAVRDLQHWSLTRPRATAVSLIFHQESFYAFNLFNKRFGADVVTVHSKNVKLCYQ